MQNLCKHTDTLKYVNVIVTFNIIKGESFMVQKMKEEKYIWNYQNNCIGLTIISIY